MSNGQLTITKARLEQLLEIESAARVYLDVHDELVRKGYTEKGFLFKPPEEYHALRKALGLEPE